MTTIKNALRRVGYQAKKPKTLENVVVEILQQVDRPLRVQVQRAGDYFKARWEGRREFYFGESVEEATARLRSSGPIAKGANKCLKS